MAEFLTMQEAEDKFGKKGKTNAALTLGIIGTALGAFSGNNGSRRDVSESSLEQQSTVLTR